MTRRNQFLATVLHNIPLCREHFRLVLGLPGFPPTQPGNFIQISCRDVEAEYCVEREVGWNCKDATRHLPELVEPLALLRRPFSLAGRRDASDGVELDIIHRVVGVGTEWLSHLKQGDRVDILGPLGNSFRLPDEAEFAILVGGGVGIPPMLYLAEALRGCGAVAFSGATSRDLLPLTIVHETREHGREWFWPLYNILEFNRHGIAGVVSTDDGSYGFEGFVTDALARFLDHLDKFAEKSRALIYTCGPEPMMKRVAEIAAQRGIECQVAVERAMACGMGTCQSCCIRVRKPDPAQVPLPGSDWCWKLACTDGPIFRGAELLW